MFHMNQDLYDTLKPTVIFSINSFTGIQEYICNFNASCKPPLLYDDRHLVFLFSATPSLRHHVHEKNLTMLISFLSSASYPQALRIPRDQFELVLFRLETAFAQSYPTKCGGLVRNSCFITARSLVLFVVKPYCLKSRAL